MPLHLFRLIHILQEACGFFNGLSDPFLDLILSVLVSAPTVLWILLF